MAREEKKIVNSVAKDEFDSGGVKWDSRVFQVFKEQKNKQFGNDLVLITGKEPLPVFGSISTEDPCLDLLLGGLEEKAGWPLSSFIEISGEENSGKTTLVYEAMAAFAKNFPSRGIAFIDCEGNFDAEYARHLGVPVHEDRFVYCLPENGEQGLTVLEQLIKTGMFSCVALDSWASIVPPMADDDDAVSTDQQIGWLAKQSSIVLGKLATTYKQYGTTFIATNQLRVNLTAMGARGYITTGGYAMRYYPRLKLRIKTTGGGKPDHLRTISVMKAQGAARVETHIEASIKWGVGLDKIESLITLGIANKKILAAGAWFSIPECEGIKAQGRNGLCDLIRSNQDVRYALCDALGVSRFDGRDVLVRKLKIETTDTNTSN